MKATDVIQPTAMQTPIAVNGSKDNIPQLQSSTSEPWYCSIENGFPDMTMQALNQGGRPPRGQGANGLFYLSTDQKVYLQNGGTITFSEAVSNAIGGYPMGAILDYVHLGVYNKVISLVNDNTVNFLTDGVDNVNWQLLTIGNGGGGGGEIGANVDLTNLTSFGNGKFQFAPFSINNGRIDSDGANVTLTSSGGGVPVPVEIINIPMLSSTTSSYGTCSATAQSSTAYEFTQNEAPDIFVTSYSWTMQLAADNHIPAGSTVTFSLMAGEVPWVSQGSYYKYGGNKGCKITYTYTDNTTAVAYDAADEGYWTVTGTWTKFTKTAIAPAKEVAAIQVDMYRQGDYVVGFGFNLKSSYSESGSNILICEPCTITTADSRSKSFDANNILDCSQEADGTYKVMKDFVYGSLSLASTLLIQKAPPTASSETAWTQPTLSADGTIGGADFACFASSSHSSYPAYKAFDGNTAGTTANEYWTTTTSGSVQGAYIGFYNPEPLKVTKLRLYNQTRTSGDGTMQSGTIQASNDNTTYVDVGSFTGNTFGTTYIDVTVNTSGNFYKYYRIVATDTGSHYRSMAEVVITATVSSGGSSFSDGDLWLDNSEYPLTLKQYDSTENNWVVNNDLVYLGDVTISSSSITSLANKQFNANMGLLSVSGIIETYHNGASWYRIYSDGWCEQGGIANLISSGTQISLLKNFKNTDYSVMAEVNGLTNFEGIYYTQIDQKTTYNFVIKHSAGASQTIVAWRACGYIA